MEKLILEGNLAEVNLTGLFGYPVEHSFSPAMHNSAFKEVNLNYLYLPFAIKPENVEEAVKGIKAFDLRGVNVTIPHKQAVIPYLDELSEEAELIGAVNTIENRDGKLIGYNTDGRGFIRSLKEEGDFEAKGKKALIIGAGGASRAVAFQLALEGIDKIYISDLSQGLAKVLADDVNSKVDKAKAIVVDSKETDEIVAKVDLLVDATPVGMYPKVDVKPVVSTEVLHKDLVVYDLVYNPLETVLLKAAKEAGAKAVSGLGMLLYQGAIAFEIWTDVDAPIKIMRNALEEMLGL
ncbi:shikimate dehydrogenase [Orenia metallireducens]|uniref:Shikimate dehydrogenase (NADP(+)) n=1 Tax=Orenia metallireducens TaxID=1413210 RepID=A0A285HL62_9FIRM|nr:shikimate dehydrogenase [Orenia metallireducens]PRX27218.1 shikimate dehydrogenase [Orenia metallireducens]SNY35431.1 shikimate dehydrogenase [Orenia metallireducens]